MDSIRTYDTGGETIARVWSGSLRTARYRNEQRSEAFWCGSRRRTFRRAGPGLPSRSSWAERPAFALGFGAAAFTRFASEGWWARQRPYEAAFLEGFLGLIKMLIRRVPTKIPTKLPRGRRSVCRPYAQSPAALWSSIASIELRR